MLLLCAGGRRFGYAHETATEAAHIQAAAEVAQIHRALAFLNPTCIVHGAATGADSVCGAWGEARGLEVVPFPVTDADWARLKKGAGPARNSTMLKYVIARRALRFAPPRVEALLCPGGVGTADMRSKLQKAGVKISELAVVLRLADERCAELSGVGPEDFATAEDMGLAPGYGPGRTVLL